MHSTINISARKTLAAGIASQKATCGCSALGLKKVFVSEYSCIVNVPMRSGSALTMGTSFPHDPPRNDPATGWSNSKEFNCIAYRARFDVVLNRVTDGVGYA